MVHLILNLVATTLRYQAVDERTLAMPLVDCVSYVVGETGNEILAFRACRADLVVHHRMPSSIVTTV